LEKNRGTEGTKLPRGTLAGTKTTVLEIVKYYMRDNLRGERNEFELA